MPLAAQQITVDITPGHATNAISPLRSLGAGIDRDPLDSVKTIYAPTDVARMLSAGWGGISYHLNTELSIQAWHWNPQGQWSDARGRGYFVGARNSSGDIQRSFGYNLPHRGTTANYGTSGGYSVVDDGDLRTYWKSNLYLSEHFTGESDALHAQWMVVDLGSVMPVNAIKIAWANPYAVNYQVQYWTGDDPIGNPAGGTWKNFPRGVVRNATGGTTLRNLANTPVNAEFVRVWMTVSSGTCDTHGSGDLRNCLGYAMREIYVGTINGKGRFVDAVHHTADSSQTLTYASSIDPWHDPAGIATDDGEQPGFDVVYKSGITRGLPMTVPVAMLYDNPENAANEIAYLEARGYVRARLIATHCVIVADSHFLLHCHPERSAAESKDPLPVVPLIDLHRSSPRGAELVTLGIRRPIDSPAMKSWRKLPDGSVALQTDKSPFDVVRLAPHFVQDDCTGGGEGRFSEDTSVRYLYATPTSALDLDHTPDGRSEGSLHSSDKL